MINSILIARIHTRRNLGMDLTRRGFKEAFLIFCMCICWNWDWTDKWTVSVSFLVHMGCHTMWIYDADGGLNTFYCIHPYMLGFQPCSTDAPLQNDCISGAFQQDTCCVFFHQLPRLFVTKSEDFYYPKTQFPPGWLMFSDQTFLFLTLLLSGHAILKHTTMYRHVEETVKYGNYLILKFPY